MFGFWGLFAPRLNGFSGPSGHFEFSGFLGLQNVLRPRRPRNDGPRSGFVFGVSAAVCALGLSSEPHVDDC